MPEITARLSTALADRYKIERHLGEELSRAIGRPVAGQTHPEARASHPVRAAEK